MFLFPAQTVYQRVRWALFHKDKGALPMDQIPIKTRKIIDKYINEGYAWGAILARIAEGHGSILKEQWSTDCADYTD